MSKRFIKQLCTTTPFWRLFAGALRPQGLTVLMYHRIVAPGDAFPGTPVGQFRAQMQWLRRHCEPIAPEHFEESLLVSSWAKPPVLVTFDDGYRDYHDNAYPILRELDIPSVVFLATSFIDDGGLIWTDAVTWAFRTTACTEFVVPWEPDVVLAIDDASTLERAELRCKHFLKGVPDIERMRWERELYTVLGVEPRASAPGRQMLDWNEVRKTADLTRYGGHTHTHPILSQLDSQRMEDEIRLCRERIERETGVAPRYFAYPNGRAQDFNDETKTLLRKHGFELGFSTVEGIHRRGMDPLAIVRQPTGSRTLGDFAFIVAGR